MRKLIFLLPILIFSITIFAAKNSSRSPGVIDGYQDINQAQRMIAGWYDMKVILPDSMGDTIKIDSLYGTGTIVRQMTNNSGTDGKVSVLTTKGTGYIDYPIPSNQPSGILPSVIKILKARTTIDTLILFIQKQDTTNR